MKPELAGKNLRLTTMERQAINLINGQHLTHAQAADIVGVTRTAFTKRVCRAQMKIKRLRLVVAELGGDASDFDRLAGLRRGEGVN